MRREFTKSTKKCVTSSHFYNLSSLTFTLTGKITYNRPRNTQDENLGKAKQSNSTNSSILERNCETKFKEIMTQKMNGSEWIFSDSPSTKREVLGSNSITINWPYMQRSIKTNGCKIRYFSRGSGKSPFKNLRMISKKKNKIFWG